MSSKDKRHSSSAVKETVSQRRAMKISNPTTDKLRPTDKQRPTDKLRQKSADSNKSIPDKRRLSSHLSHVVVTEEKHSGISRSKSSQAMLAQNYSHKQTDRRSRQSQRISTPPPPPPPVPSKSSDKKSDYRSRNVVTGLPVAPPPPKLLPSSRVKSQGAVPQYRPMMHRAEGMFDLSSIHQIPDYRGSVYDLLEEFQKQLHTSKEERQTKTRSPKKDRVSKPKGRPTEGTVHSRNNGQGLDRTIIKDTHLPSPNEEPHRQRKTLTDTSVRAYRSSQISQAEASHMESSSLSTHSLRRTGSHRVTTDSEEELLAKILFSMSQTSTNKSSQEDESDYANLWDSESGSTGLTFQTNKDVMGSLLRKKVSRQSSESAEQQNDWVATENSDSSSSSPSSLNTSQFNMDKFKSLQEKAENMDLTLADFFSDLKHSNSLLELSKIFSSTQKLSQHDCKFKCHQACEDLITDRCAGPKPEECGRDADQWASTKNLRHDADDADSGYSGSGSAGFTLTKEEICSKIQAYNESIAGRSSGAMTLPSDDSDSFQGCINVCVCIDRPINMSLSSRPTSIYEVLHREAELSPHTSPKNTVTHEQLPHNAIVSLHTASSNTASEVVGILLNKFKITDNPKSFALFEQTIQNEKEVKLRKVGDQERPLLNYLRWSTECDESKRFVLKENDSGDIMYEAFSIPELNNFLRVLEEEEAVKLTEIQNKYQIRRKQIADRLREMDVERNSNNEFRKTAR